MVRDLLCSYYVFMKIGELGIFTNLNKTLVIQDAQVFNETPLNPRRCNMILMKLLYLLYQGESFTGKEATMVFFSVTKSFQSKDVEGKFNLSFN